MVEAARRIPIDDFVLDGELVGDRLYVFDILRHGGDSVEGLPYIKRLDLLESIFESVPDQDVIAQVESALSHDTKRKTVAFVKQNGGEGVVFKRLDAPYTAGRPASGGVQRKHKFYEACSAIVDAINDGKRSVSLYVLDGDTTRVEIGNVTIPANHDIPSVGTVCEVRYLYCYPNGSLYQPVYLGPRSDISVSECQVQQLKFKVNPAVAAVA